MGPWEDSLVADGCRDTRVAVPDMGHIIHRVEVLPPLFIIEVAAFAADNDEGGLIVQGHLGWCSWFESPIRHAWHSMLSVQSHDLPVCSIQLHLPHIGPNSLAPDSEDRVLRREENSSTKMP